jgi:lysophospholipase L1-like esterase
MPQQQRSMTVSLKARLVAAGLALFIGVAACELIARLVYPAPPQLGREPQLRFQSDPALGFVHVPNQSGYLDDGLATINELGLRGRTPAIPKPANTFRILAVGDSTTFGWGVGDDETYTDRLQRQLVQTWANRQPEVINGGVSSYDLRQTVGWLERLIPMMEPDLVLVGFLWNDLHLGPPTVAASYDPSAPPRTFRMANQPTGIEAILRHSRLMFALRHAWLKIAPTAEASELDRLERALLAGSDTGYLARAWQSVDELFAQLQALGRARRFQIGVVLMPMRAQVEGDDSAASFQERASELARAHGFFVVDPLPGLRKKRDGRQFFIPYDRMHLSAEGNAALAESVLEALRNQAENIR